MGRLRVIFQGGGARLATLLAAAKALQLVAKEDGHEIVEIGGVSAGSIVAASLALPYSDSVDLVRQRLLENRAEFENDVKFLAGAFFQPTTYPPKHTSLADTILNVLILRVLWLPATRVIRLAYYLLRLTAGRSLISERKLASILAKVFVSREGIQLSMADLKFVKIFSSNLKTGEPIEYSSLDKNTSAVHLSKALSKSASVPLLFSGYLVENAEVDGGVCGNLPAQYFIDAESEAKTLVFAFPQEERSISGPISYLSALLASSMDASVREAKIQTQESGGVVCELQSQIGTYDFLKAIYWELSDDRFNRVALEFVNPVRNSLVELFGIGKHKVLKTTKYSKDEVTNIFENLYHRNPVKKDRAVKIMIDRNVRRGPGSKSDERCYVDTLSPKHEGGRIEVCQVGLPFNLTKKSVGGSNQSETSKFIPMSDLSIDVTDATGNEIDALPYLSLGTKNGRPYNRILIFIRENIKKYPIKVVTRFNGEVFAHFRNFSWDYFSTVSDLETHCAEHIWICSLPQKYSFGLRDLAEAKDEHQPEIFSNAPTLPGRIERAWVKGEKFDQTEASQLVRQHCPEGAVGGAMPRTVIAWKCAPMPPGYSGGFVFETLEEKST